MTERVAYRVSEVSVMCGISRRTVLRWVADGILPTLDLGPRKPRSAILIPASAVDAFTTVTVKRPETAA